MPEKISIMRESGDTINASIVALFSMPDNGKNYLISTENAVDPHGLTVLHVSEIVDGVLKKIATDEEWTSIKTIMRSIISGSAGNYKYIPMIKTVKADNQYSRDISVSAAAAKQISDSYAASAGESSGSTPVAEPAKEEVPVDNVTEITPGISEVPAAPAPAAPAPMAEAPSVPIPGVADVGNASTNIPESSVISKPEEVVAPEVKEDAPVVSPPPVVESTKVEEVPKQEVKKEVTEEPKKEETPTPVAAAAPVVAYVDPGFQQLLTSDYNQILMHVQNINNNLTQIAAMPALNYQPTYSSNPNGTPNFNPNATVDEIITGSTEVFNEGVRNLVATITEKIYRDLYQREAELNEREAVLLERERMLNEQLSKIANNVASIQPTNVAAPTKVVTNTVPAQKNTAPVAEAAKTEEAPTDEVKVVNAAVNSVPKPVQSVEVV